MEEERNEIIDEPSINTAQNSFLNMLEVIDKRHAIEIRFDDPMYGDIDFSVLKDRDYTRVTKIIIDKPGKITNIRNIPEGITHLTCQSQLLKSISENLPSTLEEIDCTDNLIESFDGKNTPKLKVLRLSNNEISEIDNLPSSLLILECENNQLRRLNLSNTPSLKTLHCSNNPLLMLEYVPNTLVDMQMENNPFTEISHGSSTKKGKERESGKRFEYLESIFEYFKLKNAYDTNLNKLRRTAFNDKKIARRDKVKMVKAPCISCKRKVGTIFKTHNRRYVAVCGDKEKPCNLDIQIYNSDSIYLGEYLDLYNTVFLEREKDNIIKQKMDTLFNYVSERVAIEEFKSNLKKFNETNAKYNKLLQNHESLYNSESRKLQIQHKQEEIYRLQEDISRMIEQYKKTGNRKILTDAMEVQVKDLIPAIQNLRNLKYDTMHMEEESDKTSHLIQREVAFDKNYIRDTHEDPRVIKYVIAK